MKRIAFIILSIILFISFITCHAEELEPNYDNLKEGRIELYNDDGQIIYTYAGLNPVLDISGCPKLYKPIEVYESLLFRGVPVEGFKVRLLGNRRFMILTLQNDEKYAFDVLETLDTIRYVTEESVCQFCYHYFGEDYDFRSNEP